MAWTSVAKSWNYWWIFLEFSSTSNSWWIIESTFPSEHIVEKGRITPSSMDDKPRFTDLLPTWSRAAHPRIGTHSQDTWRRKTRRNLEVSLNEWMRVIYRGRWEAGKGGICGIHYSLKKCRQQGTNSSSIKPFGMSFPRINSYVRGIHDQCQSRNKMQTITREDREKWRKALVYEKTGTPLE